MNYQQLATVAGAAVTTFLLVGAVTIEAVTAAVGGDIGPGIVGVFVGVAAGLAAGVAVSRRWSALAERADRPAGVRRVRARHRLPGGPELLDILPPHF